MTPGSGRTVNVVTGKSHFKISAPGVPANYDTFHFCALSVNL